MAARWRHGCGNQGDRNIWVVLNESQFLFHLIFFVVSLKCDNRNLVVPLGIWHQNMLKVVKLLKKLMCTHLGLYY